ncbi:DUF2076 domain-containing protein [Pseudomonas parafulva]|uniref:DUF2076 domain-containing protein n=1 Tax=Pseudomonas parafulva TaxID=157782 RepID=A0AAI8PBI4_9PSED|nr:DUF2076 domain-containing protein [Pseudomonas parafulva]AXO89983.1 DUF2076 domain-containing protein [Pseudomonas parafulva]
MNTEEQTLIDGLFTRIKQAEDPQQPRDAQAQARIEEHLRQQPAAPYYMAQAILVQEAALKQLDARVKDLEAQLKQAREQAPEASRSSGGFLSSLFGSSPRSPAPEPQRPVAPPASGGGWRDPAPAPQAYAQPPQAQAQAQGFGAAPARSGASSFLGGAMQTAAGVAGGVLLAQGISSLFNHNSQPNEVVEVIHDEPAPASDTSGWNDQDSQRQVADDSSWNTDQGGYVDSDYDSGGGGFFDDDDTFV